MSQESPVGPSARICQFNAVIFAVLTIVCGVLLVIRWVESNPHGMVGPIGFLEVIGAVFLGTWSAKWFKYAAQLRGTNRIDQLARKDRDAPASKPLQRSTVQVRGSGRN